MFMLKLYWQFLGDMHIDGAHYYYDAFTGFIY